MRNGEWFAEIWAEGLMMVRSMHVRWLNRERESDCCVCKVMVVTTRACRNGRMLKKKKRSDDAEKLIGVTTRAGWGMKRSKGARA